jgi:predicted DNA-binding transcriptional regulator YafY
VLAKRLLAHGSARSARLEVPPDLPRRLEIAAVRREGPTVKTAEASYPPLLWLVPDLPEEPDEPNRVAEVVRRHAGSLPESQQDMLARAIVAGGPVRIDYRDTGGEFSTRVIEPLELDQVLLTAWCQLRDAERMFSLDRIESVSPA